MNKPIPWGPYRHRASARRVVVLGVAWHSAARVDTGEAVVIFMEDADGRLLHYPLTSWDRVYEYLGQDREEVIG